MIIYSNNEIKVMMAFKQYDGALVKIPGFVAINKDGVFFAALTANDNQAFKIYANDMQDYGIVFLLADDQFKEDKYYLMENCFCHYKKDFYWPGSLTKENPFHKFRGDVGILEALEKYKPVNYNEESPKRKQYYIDWYRKVNGRF